MSRNWNLRERARQMRYNGAYPVNEMWDIRQNLIDEFRRFSSTNKSLASIESKCLDYLQTTRYDRSWKDFKSKLSIDRREERGKYCENQNSELEKNKGSNCEQIENLPPEEEPYNYFDDDPWGQNYRDFEEDDFGVQPKNSEFIIKEEPVTEKYAETVCNSKETDFSKEDTHDNLDKLEDSENEDRSDFITKNFTENKSLDTSNGRQNLMDSLSSNKSNCNDDIDGFSFENQKESDKQNNSDVFCDEKEENTCKRKSKNDEKSKSKKSETKAISYKEFVKSVTKLVSLDKKHKKNSSGKTEDNSDVDNKHSQCSKHHKCRSEKLSKESSNHRATSKVKKLSNQKDDRHKIIRTTRSSSRSAKVHAVEKISTKQKEEKEAKSHDSKQNTLGIKTRNRYSTRSRSTTKDENVKPVRSGNEKAITSESKQTRDKDVKLRKRKSMSSTDEDIPLVKYTKLITDDDENKSKVVELDKCNELDDTVDYSNYEENFSDDPNDNTLHSDLKLNDYNTTQAGKSVGDRIESINLETTMNQNISTDESSAEGSSLNMDAKQDESIGGTSVILIEIETDSDSKLDLKPQSSNDLDSLNNNKDTKRDKPSNEQETCYPTSNSDEKLWDYLKCDFCDFLVSKKKPDNYQVMEEHLESTKHNAASIVKVSISDGELKPFYVKKEHAILFSLEKASVLPYCPTCYMIMPSVWTVQLHAKYKHSGQTNKDIYSVGKVDSIVNVPIPRKINMCKQCGQRKVHIQKHWKAHNHYPYIQPTDDQIAQYSCNVCHRHFESFFSALSHAVVHSQEGHSIQSLGVKVTYISKSHQTLTLLPREKTLTSGRAVEMLNQARAANKQGQWTRAQRKEFEMMATEWKRSFSSSRKK